MAEHLIKFIQHGAIKTLDLEKEKLSPTTTLLNFLRKSPLHQGTKEGCAEGDCGACTVVIADLNEAGALQYTAIDSCLVFLPMLHGKQLITIEDLSTQDSNKLTLHPVQQAMVDCHGTQCGYCTPGFVMSIFALQKQEGNSSRSSIEDALTGNLCRCTGYRSIIDAATMACASNIEDHFEHQAETTRAQLNELRQTISDLEITVGEQYYFRPTKLQHALSVKRQVPDCIVFSGATDLALRVTKRHETLHKLLDLGGIPELRKISSDAKHIKIGACCTLEEIRTNLRERLPALCDMLDVFGSRQIRSLATLGGNIGSASPIGDTLPVLFAYEALIELQNETGTRRIALTDFITGYRKTDLQSNELITAIIIPAADPTAIIRSYKVSKRKDLDISTLSGGFQLQLNNNDVAAIKLAFGGMAAKTEFATSAADFLLGKSWSRENVETAAELIRQQFKPLSDARSGAAFRSLAAGNLLLKFWMETTAKS